MHELMELRHVVGSNPNNLSPLARYPEVVYSVSMRKEVSSLKDLAIPQYSFQSR